MTERSNRRARKVRILATLGPASSSPEMIRKLMRGRRGRVPDQHEPRRPEADKAKLVEAIRALEKELERPTTILFDLQGPKLRVGSFKGGSADAGDRATASSLDRDRRRATPSASSCPIPNCSRRSSAGDRLLIDDGKVRLRVVEVGDRPDRRPMVEVGGTVSNNKGVNVPDVRGADPGADREGPRRPRLRARAGRRLDRPVLRPAARGRRRGARADRRQGRAARQDREAGGDRPARRDHRSWPTR